MGLPVAVLGRTAAWATRQGSEPNRGALSPECNRILEALKEEDALPLTELAAKLSMEEHELLDHCEALFAHEIIAPAWDGAAVRLTG